ncbi:bifunctional hydroxymethylpyrimidine kinase/phosphomethylpyrimidine kinase [Candidatus Woesearchaeota archaeon]|nr:bifunctional hydroxymethylpyrimidine kinase/phosphomethylpyrimidine kinase [Candidatus Woesearchaeota archaeon]
MVDLAIVGSVALDSVRTPFGEVKDALGGAATYSSYAASFFCKPGIVAVVGEDFPKKYLDTLKKRGIDISGVKIGGKTFKWEGLYEYDMNEAKTLRTELGSFASFQPVLPESYKEAEYVFLANIDPELQLAVLEQVKNPKLVAMDTMNFWIENKKEELLKVLKKVDILLINDAEARELFKTPNLVKAANSAIKLGPKAVIIKKGEHGALLFMDGKHFSAPGYPLESLVDPTGAGDSFAGALMGYIAKTRDPSEKNIRRAIIYGSVVASFDAEGFSLARMTSINMGDIEKRYSEFHGICEF